jgi:hypothetical protein
MAGKHVLRRAAAPLAAWLVLAAAGPLSAQVIAYDPFNQTAPFQLNGTASTGVPWPTSGGNTPTWGPAFGNGGSVVPGSLAYGPLQTAGNKAQFAWFTGDNGSLRLLVNNHGGAGSDFWLSFLMTGAAGNQGLLLYQGTTLQIWFGTPGSTTNFGMRLFGSVTSEGTTQDRPVTPTVTPDTATHFLAVHFSLGSAGFTKLGHPVRRSERVEPRHGERPDRRQHRQLHHGERVPVREHRPVQPERRQRHGRDGRLRRNPHRPDVGLGIAGAGAVGGAAHRRGPGGRRGRSVEPAAGSPR